MWPNDQNEGIWTTFLSKHDNIHEARNEWLQLIREDYHRFGQIYTLEIDYSTLSTEECVFLDGSFYIISFIHPEAIKTILNDQELK